MKLGCSELKCRVMILEGSERLVGRERQCVCVWLGCEEMA